MSYKLPIIIFLFFSVTDSSFAAPGDLDPTFGQGGRVFTDIVTQEPYPWAESMVVQPDGKILVAGLLWHDGFALGQGGYIVRYLPNGTLDPSFGQNGKVFTWGSGATMAVLPDGRILVSGTLYTSAGILDTTFGENGTSACWGDSIALQADGKILGSRWVSPTFGPGEIVVFRCNTNGSRDTTFGSAGEVTVTNGAWYGSKVVVQPDGRILLIGTLAGVSPSVLLARYDHTGIPDPSFGSGGKVTLNIDPLWEYSNAAELQPDGKIVVVRQRTSSPSDSSILIRFDPNGSLDPSFGTNGVQSFDIFTPNTIFPIADGRLIISGNKYDQAGPNSFAVARLNSSGSVDPVFGNGGTSLFPMNADGANRAIAGPGAVQPDGKIVIAGAFFNYYTDSHEKIALIRVEGGRLSVSLSGRVLTPNGLGVRNATVTLIDTDGNRRSALTSSLGYYSFTNIPAGETVTIAASSRRYRFQPITRSIAESLSDVNLVGIE